MEMEGNVVEKLVYWGWWTFCKTGGEGKGKGEKIMRKKRRRNALEGKERGGKRLQKRAS